VRNAQLDQQLAEATSDTQLQILEVKSAIERYEQELADKALIVSEYDGRVLEITTAVGQIISAGQRLGSIETEDERGELVAVTYFAVGDGKKIESEMAVRISPVTVQRERFGSMLGQVRSVSRFPVTLEAITNVVGSAEVAQGLARQGPSIEVFARLQEDSATPSGYRWTSGSGPDTRVTAGTTVAIRVTIDYRRPITYVLPLLRSWSGF
jgi:HlyD family secretion protein